MLLFCLYALIKNCKIVLVDLADINTFNIYLNLETA